MSECRCGCKCGSKCVCNEDLDKLAQRLQDEKIARFTDSLKDYENTGVRIEYAVEAFEIWSYREHALDQIDRKHFSGYQIPFFAATECFRLFLRALLAHPEAKENIPLVFVNRAFTCSYKLSRGFNYESHTEYGKLFNLATDGTASDDVVRHETSEFNFSTPFAGPFDSVVDDAVEAFAKDCRADANAGKYSAAVYDAGLKEQFPNMLATDRAECAAALAGSSQALSIMLSSGKSGEAYHHVNPQEKVDVQDRQAGDSQPSDSAIHVQPENGAQDGPRGQQDGSAQPRSQTDGPGCPSA
jgi:hypothetical protein